MLVVRRWVTWWGSKFLQNFSRTHSPEFTCSLEGEVRALSNWFALPRFADSLHVKSLSTQFNSHPLLMTDGPGLLFTQGI